jgi:hypothetical protein
MNLVKPFLIEKKLSATATDEESSWRDGGASINHQCYTGRLLIY